MGSELLTDILAPLVMLAVGMFLIGLCRRGR